MSADIQMALVPHVSLFLFVFLRRQEREAKDQGVAAVCQGVCCGTPKGRGLIYSSGWWLGVLAGVLWVYARKSRGVMCGAPPGVVVALLGPLGPGKWMDPPERKLWCASGSSFLLVGGNWSCRMSSSTTQPVGVVTTVSFPFFLCSVVWQGPRGDYAIIRWDYC